MLNGLVVHFHVKPDIHALFYPLLTIVFYIIIYPRFISTISVGEYGRLCIQTNKCNKICNCSASGSISRCFVKISYEYLIPFGL